ncbi:UNVERIFIED_CONTAM: hypothetical protein NCL1_35543 [Trichonephila clavipes]
MGVSLQIDYLIGTSAHAPQQPIVTYTGMGTVGLALMGCCVTGFEGLLRICGRICHKYPTLKELKSGITNDSIKINYSLKKQQLKNPLLYLIELKILFRNAEEAAVAEWYSSIHYKSVYPGKNDDALLS